MRYIKIFKLVILVCFIAHQQTSSYHLPVGLNLGATNILDGGPKVITPGWYWIQYQLDYYAHKFLDACGNPRGGVKSPWFNAFAVFIEHLYQSKHKIFHGAPGASFIWTPLVLLHTSDNTIGVISKKIGVGNPAFHFFYQWDMINLREQPFFVHRMATVVILPYGTNKFPQKTSNPADIMTSVDTYWAATLYFTERCAISWRLFYLWCGKNKKTKIQPGRAFHMNYSAECEAYKNCWIGINGYYLQQLTNDRQYGIEIPDSKERVFAVGPGWDLFLPRDFQLLGHLYFESKARNRTQGVTAYLNFIKHF